MTDNPAPVAPTVGRIVLYTLTEHDAALINSRVDAARHHNGARVGDVYAALVVRVFETSTSAANLQVFLDGDCSYWATSRCEGDEPGMWAWPPEWTAPALAGSTAKARGSHYGETAYDAYCKAVGGVSVRNEPLPTYDEMRERNPKVAEAWNRAGEAVALRFTTRA